MIRAAAEIEYPESDGKPMGETDLHRDWIVRIIELLRQRYRGQRVYVSGDLLVYYEEGVPAKFIVPDVFAIKDCDPGRRRVFKIWEEHKVPEVVFELTSKSTRLEDLIFKPQVFAHIGIPEYFLYDPTADYLTPPLQGYRLQPPGYTPIQADSAGGLACEQFDLRLCLDQGRLQIYDRNTGALLRTESEAEQAAHQAERVARQVAEKRAAEAEAKLEQLRARLGLERNER